MERTSQFNCEGSNKVKEFNERRIDSESVSFSVVQAVTTSGGTMKKMAIILVTTVLICSVFVSCSDNHTNLTPDIPADQSALAGNTNTELVKVVESDNYGPAVEKWVMPETWDGHSPLKNGVVYKFSCYDEVRAAAAATSQDYLEFIEDIAKGEPSGKVKNTLSLAHEYTFHADAAVTDYGRYLMAGAQCDTDSGWTGNILHHYCYVDAGPIYTLNEYYADQQAHFDFIYKYPQCFTSATAIARIKVDSSTKSEEFASGVCEE